MKVLLPTNVELDPHLPTGAVGIHYDPYSLIPDEHLDAGVLVEWSFSSRKMADAAARMPDLRLVQSLAAGADNALAASFAPSVSICSGVGLHDAPVTEHALALILSLVRRLPACLAAQQRHEWSRELGGTQPLRGEKHITMLRGARVLIWGFGSIAETLAPVLASLGAEVRGVARTAGQRAGFDVITVEDLPEALPEVDLLVMILPGTPDTENALNAERLAMLNERALVVNVGRGSTVDEAALLEALQDGSIAGAAIDVTATEPLPADSALWDAPNLLVTPHAAGGRPVNADDLIAANVSALLSGEPLKNLVSKGR
ncbi:MAG: NAD(P)-dependent oxidoreductase [Propionibacteriaceae bacterium]|nr:NAD(P)-dependent oxidoreductase [Propionibacteriaceae bacterium]